MLASKRIPQILFSLRLELMLLSFQTQTTFSGEVKARVDLFVFYAFSYGACKNYAQGGDPSKKLNTPTYLGMAYISGKLMAREGLA